MFTHYRCGGILNPEQHRRWALERRTNMSVDTPILRHDSETLHRCDRCGLVGVAGPPPKDSRHGD